MSPWDRLAILEQAFTWCQQGHSVWLFHVLQTWGSSPRPAGSLMAMNGSGEQAGSVSGGCVEADLAISLAASDSTIHVINYDDTSSNIHLPCGGQLQLLAEPVHSTQIEPLIEAYRRQSPLLRGVNIKSGEINLQDASLGDQPLSSEGDWVYETFGLQWRLLLIGAEHLSTLVARIAQTLEYQIIVCDPREEKHRQWQEPQIQLVNVMPDDAVKIYANNSHTAVLALSHDPKLDDMALMEALNSEAFYVGALGSLRSTQRRREQLQSMGLTDAQLLKLDAPIGIDIGSHSAAEIAVSIAAKLVQVRNTMNQANS
jgi:xanthine dehydrogenase accessory factor